MEHQIKDLKVRHLAHASVSIEDDSGHVFVFDPWYANGFLFRPIDDKKTLLEQCSMNKIWWKRIKEDTSVPLEDITKCNGIFISHLHGDHWDAPAVAEILSGTGAKVYLPHRIVSHALMSGFPMKWIVSVEREESYRFGETEVVCLSGYDDWIDSDTCFTRRLSFLVKTPQAAIFYSGDCHSKPKNLGDYTNQVDAAILWPVEGIIRELHDDIGINRFFLMHFGLEDFSFNYFNRDEHLNSIRTLFPDLDISIA